MLRSIVGLASTLSRRRRSVLILLVISAVLSVSVGSSATGGQSLAEFEQRVDAALEAAGTALDQEDARLDELAVRSSGSPLSDGRPSLGQVAAQTRLLDRMIRDMRVEEGELRKKMEDVLSDLGPDIAVLTQRVSARQPVSLEPSRGTGGDEADRDLIVGNLFRDCPDCPEMVVIASGRFDMGSPPTERGRLDSEGPVLSVSVGYRFAVGVHEVTRGEFSQFVFATNRAMGRSCWAWDGKWTDQIGVGWRNPGFQQDDEHPVVCVSWNDAKAYVRWLSERTGKRYRLLSESEWEYAARAGTTTAHYWGADSSVQCRHANGADASTDYPRSVGCDDGHPHTSPVGTYDANGFGLHDVLGNVFEWVDDCWNDSYRSSPSDGGAWESGDCDRRVFRGGAWLNEPRFLRSAFRVRYAPGYRSNVLGFRVARTLEP